VDKKFRKGDDKVRKVSTAEQIYNMKKSGFSNQEVKRELKECREISRGMRRVEREEKRNK
jgi:hypothetical protein